MEVDSHGAPRWWDDLADDGAGSAVVASEPSVEDGLGVFRSVATGAVSAAEVFGAEEGDDDVGGRRRDDGGTQSALTRTLRDLTSSVALSLAPRRALVLLGAAVGAVVLLAVLVSGGGGPAAEPALPVAGSAAGDPDGSLPAAETSEASDRAGLSGGDLGAGDGDGRGGASGSGPGGGSGGVLVHVAGAVVAPGVHLLPAGARVHDAIAAAGGPRPEADLDRLNLAAPLADGTQVYVAFSGAGGSGAVGGPGGEGAGSGAAPGGPVSLSTADAASLDALPGVGPSTAAAIIAHREANGPFTSVDDLLEVRGIGSAKLEGLRDLVVP